MAEYDSGVNSKGVPSILSMVSRWLGKALKERMDCIAERSY